MKEGAAVNHSIVIQFHIQRWDMPCMTDLVKVAHLAAVREAVEHSHSGEAHSKHVVTSEIGVTIAVCTGGLL